MFWYLNRNLYPVRLSKLFDLLHLNLNTSGVVVKILSSDVFIP